MTREAAYGTPIPPEITVPDVLETRLGTLRFTDGFPDDATVEKVFDNLDFQRGVQAFLTAMPAASQAAQRRAYRQFGPDNQTVLVFETLMDTPIGVFDRQHPRASTRRPGWTCAAARSSSRAHRACWGWWTTSGSTT